MTSTDRPDWHTLAACRGHLHVMFPTRTTNTAEQARAICATCPVTQPCLQHALTTGERFGVWGGTSERQRRRLRREHPGVAPRRRRGAGSKAAAR